MLWLKNKGGFDHPYFFNNSIKTWRLYLPMKVGEAVKRSRNAYRQQIREYRQQAKCARDIDYYKEKERKREETKRYAHDRFLRSLQTTSKQLLWLFSINGVLWIWCSYVLAFMDKAQIAEALSSNVCTVIIGQMCMYLVSKTVENVFKYNDLGGKSNIGALKNEGVESDVPVSIPDPTKPPDIIHIDPNKRVDSEDSTESSDTSSGSSSSESDATIVSIDPESIPDEPSSEFIVE